MKSSVLRDVSTDDGNNWDQVGEMHVSNTNSKEDFTFDSVNQYGVNILLTLM